jgi:Cu(I)/Ag(I) efflux system membrane fusion protein
MVTLGEYVKEGTKLFEVVDLSKVWIVFDAYESDIAWIKKGAKVEVKIGAFPGEKFQGKVGFIAPLISPKTRTASVRIDVNNSLKKLKPEMFAEAKLMASHLFKEAIISVPKSAVMWTGTRSIVYVKLPGTKTPTFQYRAITMGLDLGDYYVVENGIKAGEEVVVNGTFKVDAAAQLAGKNSMMNPPGKPAQNPMEIEKKGTIK